VEAVDVRNSFSGKHIQGFCRGDSILTMPTELMNARHVEKLNFGLIRMWLRVAAFRPYRRRLLSQKRAGNATGNAPLDVG
jgi:hypothetical protein